MSYLFLLLLLHTWSSYLHCIQFIFFKYFLDELYSDLFIRIHKSIIPLFKTNSISALNESKHKQNIFFCLTVKHYFRKGKVITQHGVHFVRRHIFQHHSSLLSGNGPTKKPIEKKKKNKKDFRLSGVLEQISSRRKEKTPLF